MKGVFAIGIDRRFADELARGVLAEYGGDPLGLADVLILVPTRRSVRALREAFLRASDGKPTILPRMAPLGDVDDSEWGLSPGDDAALALPPAIDPMEREALLARLVAAFRDDQGHPIAQSAAQALKLARELGGLLDELSIEGVGFDRLAGLVTGNFAEHWRRTLTFLDIVGTAWPAMLAERGQIDSIGRRTLAIRAQATRWRNHPPATPVIAAGSTGSQPATRELLAVVAGLPLGAIVLPGLDSEMDRDSWDKLEPSHPQFGLHELLLALGVDRTSVPDWPGSRGGDRARRTLVAELMRPAETSEAWARPDPAALDHVARADCATSHQEAVVIALALREALNEPRRTAALITPDRELARRVGAELRRWNIEIDDSAGTPLADTPPATLLRALLAAVDGGFGPVDLLALLKHPLCVLGRSRADLLDTARRLDRKYLRGLKPAIGLEAVRRIVANRRKDDDADADAVRALIDRLDAATSGLAVLMTEGAPPDALLDATIAAAEMVSSADTLWRGEAGEAMAETLARLRGAWRDQPTVAGGEWPGLLAAMLASATIRPRYGRHPRLSIWGPLEARLQRADLVILGGLNEGSWPPSVETGPWLNRPMRGALGLPQPERRIGLSAHDFVSALAADHVLLTRAEREGGAPTVSSRWLARLDALLGHDPNSAGELPKYIQRGRRYIDWAEAIDRPDDYKPWPRPEPRPPLAARPTELSVSSIEQWRRDPYGLYARQILKLRLLDPLEAELGAAERGSALHAALDDFLKRHPSGLLPGDAIHELEDIGERHLGELLTAPAERAFWWPRFQRLARWFVGEENRRRASGLRLLDGETAGSIKVGPRNRPLTITAIADRIDELGTGVWEVIDYKTGRVPSTRELEGLFAPQLLLEAAMAETGGFRKIKGKAAEVILTYWRANGLGDGGEIKNIKGADKLIPAMLALVEKMAERYANPATPYVALPQPEFVPHFNDYEHLERVAEWSTTGGSDE
ncbi:MAG: double-strand break repair protein AddB [Rhodospirillales bacterium]|nr:double-strand break repair protein AddB [Rhodospirillales bacterium]